jgi:uncharacterized membrane protein YhhN
MTEVQRLPKIVLAASIVGGVSYMAQPLLNLPDAIVLAWKGSGVALLAAYAALRASGRDGWMIAGVMAFGALGDVLLNAFGLTVGAVAFLIGHLVAVALYWAHRRQDLTRGQLISGALMIPAIAVTAFELPADRAFAPGVALYATGLAAMAATAWMSRFPRALVGLGALAFVVSDLLIFARSGPLAHDVLAAAAIWPLYYGGQLAICLGVTRTLARDAAAI